MTGYVDSMKVDDVLYEIHDTNARTELETKVSRDPASPSTLTVGQDETGQFFIEV